MIDGKRRNNSPTNETGTPAGAADSRGSRGIIAEESELYCRFERRGDDSDDGWDNYSEERRRRRMAMLPILNPLPLPAVLAEPPPPPPPPSISMSHPPARGPSRPAGSLPPSPGPPGLAPQPLIVHRPAQSAIGRIFLSITRSVNVATRKTSCWRVLMFGLSHFVINLYPTWWLW